MKTLAILTNGGDTCALNASIRSIRDNAYNVGYKKIYGIRRGYQGLIDGWIDDITGREIDVRIGGSCLGSMRISPTRKADKPPGNYEIDEGLCLGMAKCLSDYKIDVLVVIGGDGTLQSTQMFQNWVQENKNTKKFRPFEIMGFLKTIDNDIRTFTSFEGVEMALCPGYPSAVKKIITSVEALRVTARTAERAFAVEIMGRDAGWLAASATFGGAEILLVPELPAYYAEHFLSGSEDARGREKSASDMLLKDLASEIAYFYRKNRNVIIAVGEGFEPKLDIPAQQEFVRLLRDLYGPRKKAGATELLTMLVAPYLDRYFRCYSRFAGNEHMEDCIERRLKDIIRQEELKKGDKDQGQHPLQGWDIEQELQKTVVPKEGDAASEARGSSITTNSKRPPHPEKSGPNGSRSLNRMVEVSNMGVPPYKFEIRPHRTDYLPRSGQPSSYDFRFATVLGSKIGQMLLAGKYGYVPALDKVVPYDELTLERIVPVSINEIKTLGFSSSDYFKEDSRFQVSERITQFFRTITTGPESLEWKSACKRAPRRRRIGTHLWHTIHPYVTP
ncbi:MAG: 6-phosphofructokinase, partial [Sedimentisphaerales bacterium]|nr:6-phosphofructokinase [Sedimentisphaerales bacterium]